MLLTPVKYKPQISDPKLTDLYKVGEYHTGEFWGKPCRKHYRNECDDFGQAISRLVILTAERASGYCIPGTDFPYLLIAMRMLAKMEELGADYEKQLAGLAWVLVYHKFATVEEIKEICGTYVANLVTVEQEQNNKITEDESIFAQNIINIWGCLTRMQKKFIQIETSLLLDVLMNIRIKHDHAFKKENPEPINYLYENISQMGWMWYSEDSDCYYESGFRQCDHDCNYDEEDIDRDYSGLNHYYSKQYYVHECKEDELGYCRGSVLEIPYTPEYMAYCDKCRDLFWQRFGLHYEDAEKMLIALFWNGESPKNPLNDLLYEVSERYHVCE